MTAPPLSNPRLLILGAGGQLGQHLQAALAGLAVTALSHRDCDIGDDRAVTIDMTLTTPNCPSAQELPSMVENAAASVPGVGPVTVNIVWDPPWEPSRMSDEARMVLNMW